MVTVKDMINQYLQKHGYAGLYNDHECGCTLEDLIPCCGAGIESCRAGYVVKPPPEYADDPGTWVGPKPPVDG